MKHLLLRDWVTLSLTLSAVVCEQALHWTPGFNNCPSLTFRLSQSGPFRGWPNQYGLLRNVPVVKLKVLCYRKPLNPGQTRMVGHPTHTTQACNHFLTHWSFALGVKSQDHRNIVGETFFPNGGVCSSLRIDDWSQSPRLSFPKRGTVNKSSVLGRSSWKPQIGELRYLEKPKPGPELDWSGKPEHAPLTRRKPDRQGRSGFRGFRKAALSAHLKDDICLSDACLSGLLPNFCDTGRRPSPIFSQIRINLELLSISFPGGGILWDYPGW